MSPAGINGPIVNTFVDDIKIMRAKNSGVINQVKQELTAAFEMADMGPISFYFGLKVSRDREKKTIKLSQPAYIDKILAKFYLSQANTLNTPMKETPLKPSEKEATAAKRKRYQGMTGSIMFSMVETRPDITFATSVVSRFAKNLFHQYSKAVKTIFWYLKATRDTGITYGWKQGGNLIIKGYFDSDWAGDHATRKSTSGYIFILNGGPVSWCSKRQSTVALSLTEAEYVVLTLASKETTWLRLLLTELGLLLLNHQYVKIKVAEGSRGAKEIKVNLKDQEKENNRSMASKTTSTYSSTSCKAISLKGDN